MAVATRDVRALRSVPTAVADGLISHGCRDATSLLAAPEVVVQILQQLRAPCPDATAAKIIAACQAEVSGRWKSAPSALDLLQQAHERTFISMPCHGLNALLGGGLGACGFLEICGVPGSGKTQLCLQACCCAQLHNASNGATGPYESFEAVFIDTEGSFTARRYSDVCATFIAEKSSHGEAAPNLDAVLAGLHVYRVFDAVELVSAVMVLDEFLTQHPRVKFIALDSIAFCFRHEFNDDFAARARALLQIASALRQLTKKHSVAVMVTNHITTKVGDGGRSSQLIPALGDTWAHQPSTQIRLDKAGLQIAGWQVGTATLTKSVDQATGQQCTFMITAGGIRDAVQGH